MSCNTSSEDREVIAWVGNKPVYYDDYYKSYHLEPRYRKGQTKIEARRKQLDFFIDQKLLAFGGEGARVDTSHFFAERQRWQQEKTLVGLYLANQIDSTIEITDREYYAGFD